MKRLLLISILLVGLLITGCSQKGLSQNELFEKKKECASYKESLQKEIDKAIYDFEKMGINHSEEIGEIFYSEKEVSCFAVTSYNRIFDGGTAWCNKIINILDNTYNTYCNEEEQESYYSKYRELKGK